MVSWYRSRSELPYLVGMGLVAALASRTHTTLVGVVRSDHSSFAWLLSMESDFDAPNGSLYYIVG